MSVTTPISLFLGEAGTFRLTSIDKDTGDRLDLSIYSSLEVEVKLADGDGDPPLIAKTLGVGIALVDLGVNGQADVSFFTADTTTNPEWPAAPGNVGFFRYDFVGIKSSGDRDQLIPPSDFEVRAVVNTP